MDEILRLKGLKCRTKTRSVKNVFVRFFERALNTAGVSSADYGWWYVRLLILSGVILIISLNAVWFGLYAEGMLSNLLVLYIGFYLPLRKIERTQTRAIEQQLTELLQAFSAAARQERGIQRAFIEAVSCVGSGPLSQTLQEAARLHAAGFSVIPVLEIITKKYRSRRIQHIVKLIILLLDHGKASPQSLHRFVEYLLPMLRGPLTPSQKMVGRLLKLCACTSACILVGLGVFLSLEDVSVTSLTSDSLLFGVIFMVTGYGLVWQLEAGGIQ